jgi:hypothetical protein
MYVSPASRQPAEDDEKRCSEEQRQRDDLVGSVERHLENRLQEDERVELAGVPDHRLPRRRAKQHREKDLPPLRGAVTVGDGRGRRLPFCF